MTMCAPGAGATTVALAFDYFPDAHGEKHMARGTCGRSREQCVCGKHTFLFIVAWEHRQLCFVSAVFVSVTIRSNNLRDTHSGMVLPKPWWKLKSHADGGTVLLPIRRSINKTNDKNPTTGNSTDIVAVEEREEQPYVHPEWPGQCYCRRTLQFDGCWDCGFPPYQGWLRRFEVD